MLLFARAVAVLTAVIVVGNIAVGAMTDPDFLVPDLVLAAALVVSGLLPSRGAEMALPAALAFALGVFGVAISTQSGAGETNWSLMVLIAFDLAALVFAALALRKRVAAA